MVALPPDDRGRLTLTGVRMGRGLIREIRQSGVPTLLSEAEGNTTGVVIARRRSAPRGRRPLARAESSCETGRPATAARDRVTGGHDCSARGGRGHERCLRSGLPRLLVRLPARPQPASRPGCARNGTRPGPRSASTSVPEVGAQCVSSARWDLCGGGPSRPAWRRRAVPTATGFWGP